MAKHLLASTTSTVFTFRSSTNIAPARIFHSIFVVTLIFPTGVPIENRPGPGFFNKLAMAAGPPSTCPRLSWEIICRQTVSRSQAMFSCWCNFNCCFARFRSPRVTHLVYRPSSSRSASWRRSLDSCRNGYAFSTTSCRYWSFNCRWPTY